VSDADSAPGTADDPREQRWFHGWGSARGPSHIRSDKPNQDSVKVSSVQVAPPLGQTFIACVADGHGSATAYRSDKGAQFAVEIAGAVVAGALEPGGDVGATSPGPDWAGAPADAWASLVETVAKQICSKWVERVEGDIRETEDARAGLGAGNDSGPDRTGTDSTVDAPDLRAYGSTLIVGILADCGVGVLQIGDGDAIGLFSPQGQGVRAERLTPPDPRLMGNATTSLSLPDAAEDFRHGAWFTASGPGGLPWGVVIATDGFGNAMVSDDALHATVRDLVEYASQDGQDEPGWVSEWLETNVARFSGDDASMVLFWRAASHTSSAPGPEPG